MSKEKSTVVCNHGWGFHCDLCWPLGTRWSKKDQAQAMYQAWLDAPRIDKQDRLDALVKFKKQAKKGWDALGIPDPTAKPAVEAFREECAAVTKALQPMPTTPSLFPPAAEIKPVEKPTPPVKLERKVQPQTVNPCLDLPPYPELSAPSERVIQSIKARFHTDSCISQHTEWSGSPNPDNPDNEWVCDECDAVIPAIPLVSVPYHHPFLNNNTQE